MNHVVKRFAVPALAAAMAMVGAVAAAQGDYDSDPLYGAVMAGYVFHDSAYDTGTAFGYDNGGIALHGVLGYGAFESLAFEFNVSGTQTTRIDDGEDYAYGAGLDLNLGDPSPWSPFFLVGAGYLFEDFSSQERTSSPYANIGLGLYFPGFGRFQQVRLEGRYNVVSYSNDVVEAELGTDQTEEVRVNLGLQFGSGPRVPPQAAVEPVAPVVLTDSDGDGVPDFNDTCPGTSGGTPVGPNGCPVIGDADGDRVLDDIDQCPNTPKTIAATPTGCTPDSDAEGVTDDRDRCPGTDAGESVDDRGCPPIKDADGDKVADDRDLCPDTPAGTPVNVLGCPLDADGDGVPDGTDQCANTPRDYAVDERGCVIVQKVVLTGVNFALGSHQLTAEAQNVLNSVADSLKLTPSLTVEIAGHTDSTGSAQYNLALSKRRAESVRQYLASQGVPAERLRAEGYGLGQPVADNSSDEGRARNRRVEFRVVNK